MLWKRASPAVALAIPFGLAALHGQVTPPGEHGAALAAIREYALNYSKSAPDYTCTRVTRGGFKEMGLNFSNRPETFEDNPPIQVAGVDIKEDLTISGQRERYRVVKVDATGPLHGGQLEAP